MISMGNVYVGLASDVTGNIYANSGVSRTAVIRLSECSL